MSARLSAAMLVIANRTTSAPRNRCMYRPHTDYDRNSTTEHGRDRDRRFTHGNRECLSSLSWPSTPVAEEGGNRGISQPCDEDGLRCPAPGVQASFARA